MVEIRNNISGNTNGGAVCVDACGSFTMTGGIISGNESPQNNANGGGVLINSGSFTMTGGIISGNKAGNQGGGVYVSNGDTFTKSGASSIYGNTSLSNGDGKNVFVRSGSPNKYRNSDAGPGVDIYAVYSGGSYVTLSGFDN